MFGIPYDALHPAVVHFPIAGLVLGAVLLVLLAVVPGRSRTGLTMATAAVLIITCLSAWLAISTGEATYEAVESPAVYPDMSPQASALMHEHEEASEVLGPLTTALAGLFVLGWLAGPRLPKKLRPTWAVVLASVVFAGLYAGTLYQLSRAAHMGGQLVHAHKITAPMPIDQALIKHAAEEQGDGHEDLDH